jgi:thiol-disulfide isomerase/thioredoxin
MNLIRSISTLPLAILLLFPVFSTAQKSFIPKWKITELVQLMNQPDSVLVINFWATFCAPCVEEIPDLIRLSRKYRNEKLKLYLISLDLADSYPAKIEKFVKKKGWKANIRWLQETNADYFCPFIDASWSGSLPATLILNRKTGVKQFFEKKLSAEEIENAIKKVL